MSKPTSAEIVQGIQSFYMTPCSESMDILKLIKKCLAWKPEDDPKPATHEITACYFPGLGIVELSWQDNDTGKKAVLEKKVTKEEGEAISETVMSCVYSQANVAHVLPRLSVAPENMQEGELYILASRWENHHIVRATGEKDVVVDAGDEDCYYSLGPDYAKALYGPIHLEKKEEE